MPHRRICDPAVGTFWYRYISFHRYLGQHQAGAGPCHQSFRWTV